VRAGEEFFNFHNHDMVRVAVAIPPVRVADPAFNGEQTIALMREAAENGREIKGIETMRSKTKEIQQAMLRMAI